MNINESAENYLETILQLSKTLPVVRSVDIANELGFKKSSVSVAMKNLRQKEHITVTDAGVTTVDDGTAHTWSNATGNFFVIADSGDYVMKKMDKDAYVHGDSPIFGYGRTYARSYNYTSELKGSVDDGITGEYYPETTITATGWTISDVTLNSVEDSSHKDLYKISTMTYEITGEGIQPYTAVFSQYIVPAEITAERSVHFTDGQNAIFAAIPVMIILAVLLGVVALVIRSRMD